MSTFESRNLTTGDDSDDEIPDLVLIPSELSKPIPVTILSGFLGSGKTTLLNYILTENHNKRIAVIENEFGEGLGVESMIAKSGVDGSNISNFFELGNGCICCTVKDDLLLTLEQLVAHKDRFDYIIIETDGLANPGPVVSTFWTDDELSQTLCLDGLVCVVDSYNISNYIATADISDDIRTQLCFADRILLNKSDLLSKEQMMHVHDIVKDINSFAQVKETVYSKIDLDFVLNTGSYRSASQQPAATNSGADMIDSQQLFLQCLPCDSTATATNNNASTVNNSDRIEVSSDPYFRMLQIQEHSRVSKHTSSSSGISTMNTCYLKLPGVMNLKSLEVAIDELLYSGSHITDASHDSMRIYRMKGVIHSNSNESLYILQAVHNIFDITASSYKSNSEHDMSNGCNLFVIVGKNLDHSYINNLITACVRD